MRYNVITSLSRFQNIQPLVAMLRPHRVIWHVITDLELPFGLSFDHHWIRSYRFPNGAPRFWEKCHNALNQFLDNVPLNENERYCFMNDDDAYEPDFFNKIDCHTGEVVIASMERGHQTPPGTAPESAHGFDKLVASPENAVPCKVGLEQIILSGKVASKVRLPLTVTGDGEMIAWVAANYKVEYAPEANVWFNYYEPGRWNK